ncbi:hypothetical protein FIBSPDRAFT_947694, partial [Athelia psychrophila]
APAGPRHGTTADEPSAPADVIARDEKSPTPAASAQASSLAESQSIAESDFVKGNEKEKRGDLFAPAASSEAVSQLAVTKDLTAATSAAPIEAPSPAVAQHPSGEGNPTPAPQSLKGVAKAKNSAPPIPTAPTQAAAVTQPAKRLSLQERMAQAAAVKQKRATGPSSPDPAAVPSKDQKPKDLKVDTGSTGQPKSVNTKVDTADTNTKKAASGASTKATKPATPAADSNAHISTTVPPVAAATVNSPTKAASIPALNFGAIPFAPATAPIGKANDDNAQDLMSLDSSDTWSNNF